MIRTAKNIYVHGAGLKLKKCRFVPIIGQEIHNVEQLVNNYHGIASQFKYSCIKRAQAPATYRA